VTPFASDLGVSSLLFSLFPATSRPNISLVPQTDMGFMLLLRPSNGERFQLSAGLYRLILALKLAENGADPERMASAAANGYVRVQLEDDQ
jgi:hypothetical protein